MEHQTDLQTESTHGPAHPSDCASHHGGHTHHGHHGEPDHALSPDNGSLPSLLGRCAHAVRRGGHGRMAQERVLRILSQQEDGMGQRQLQELLGIQPGSLSELVSKLESRELLIRVRDQADKRNVKLLLTDAGRAAARPSDCPDPFAALTREEQEQLRALLQKLLDGQDQGGEPPCG